MSAQDLSESLREQVAGARAEARSLRIVGTDSKAFYGNPVDAAPLAVGGHTGITNYEPTELVLTARAGTPLGEVETALADKGQMLPFEPPQFAGKGSVGGAVAAGLSGPRRPYAGSVRDMVLGLKLLNGRAEVMQFGGEVMKNVAGYDASRLNTGALGTLGAILEVSLKVLPRPQADATLVLERPASECHAASETWLRAGRPVSALIHDGTRMIVRLSGTHSAVSDAVQDIGGEAMAADAAAALWTSVRDHTHPFFAEGDAPLWRLSLPPGVDPASFPGPQLVDWAGQQIWVRAVVDAAQLREAAANAGGSATLFHGRQAGVGAFHPLDPVKARLYQGLKDAFDPDGIFNPGRLYPALEEH